MKSEAQQRIEAELLRILRASPEGCGWYALEMQCGIPRAEFPPGTNVMTFLEALESEGAVRKVDHQGKQRYVANGTQVGLG
jgi:hypothetical protein